MKHIVRILSDLGDDIVLAPERWLAQNGDDDDGVRLGDLVEERREKSNAANDPEDVVVLDTTHAKDGVLDIPAALRATPSAKSVKKLALGGDLVISRLRPYLRQIAFVHPRALAMIGKRSLALSSEFYVLQPRRTQDSLAFLLPFLLGDVAQTILAAAQEGGHHPRVPRTSLLSLRVPEVVVSDRKRRSRDVLHALDALYTSVDAYEDVLRRRA